MGSGGIPVFATPAMVALMERAAVRVLQRYLEPGEESVGAAVDVKPIPLSRPGLSERE